jgi:hypothetical protein
VVLNKIAKEIHNFLCNLATKIDEQVAYIFSWLFANKHVMELYCLGCLQVEITI